MDRLKEKWGITSNFQFWVIMLMFSLAGMSVVYIRKPAFELLGLTNAPLWIKVPAYVAIVFPSYKLLLLFWGTVLGQFRFAWWFVRKMLFRMRLIRTEPHR